MEDLETQEESQLIRNWPCSSGYAAMIYPSIGCGDGDQDTRSAVSALGMSGEGGIGAMELSTRTLAGALLRLGGMANDIQGLEMLSRRLRGTAARAWIRYTC
jgi:hypothetical protein